MATFAERMKSLREQLGLTQQEEAEKLNVTKQTISQYERGKRKPDMESLEAISDFFNVSTDYVLGKTDVTIQIVDEEDLKILRDQSFRKLFKYYCALNELGVKKVENYIDDLKPEYFKQKEEKEHGEDV